MLCASAGGADARAHAHAHAHACTAHTRTHTRAATAVSLALGTHWVCNFALGQLFLPAVAAVGVPGVYLFFSAVCVACLLFARGAVIETKGLTLEQIQAAMAGKQ